MTLRLWSEAFDSGGAMPARYTADGENVSPPLRWSEVPTGARELLLYLEDLDAGEARPFVHWIVWRIPPRLDGLPEAMGAPDLAGTAPLAMAIHRSGGEPGGATETLEGKNSLERAGYDGPEPPDEKMHRYRFRLLALDTPVEVAGAPDRDALERATKGHVVEEAALVATYGRRL